MPQKARTQAQDGRRRATRDKVTNAVVGRLRAKGGVLATSQPGTLAVEANRITGTILRLKGQRSA